MFYNCCLHGTLWQYLFLVVSYSDDFYVHGAPQEQKASGSQQVTNIWELHSNTWPHLKKQAFYFDFDLVLGKKWEKSVTSLYRYLLYFNLAEVVLCNVTGDFEFANRWALDGTFHFCVYRYHLSQRHCNLLVLSFVVHCSITVDAVFVKPCAIFFPSMVFFSGLGFLLGGETDIIILNMAERMLCDDLQRWSSTLHWFTAPSGGGRMYYSEIPKRQRPVFFLHFQFVFLFVTFIYKGKKMKPF